MTTKIMAAPSLILLIFLVGFPQISETIYTPSLPTITQELSTSASLVEFTLSIYFIGFALGVFLWGILCDRLGRKPSMLLGLALYTLASLGCYYAGEINTLLAFRLFQGLGAASGSIVTQTIMRDVFHGAKRSQVFSLIGGVLALSPAVGPLIGGFAAEYYGWSSNFLILVIMGLVLSIFSTSYLRETRPEHLHQRSAAEYFTVAKKIIRDRRVLSFAFLIGGTNGIIFGFFAEGPFIFVDILGFSPSTYGLIGLVISGATIIGSSISHRASTNYGPYPIILSGLLCIIAGSSLLSIGAYLEIISSASQYYGSIWTFASLFIIFLGISLVIPNTLSIALADYSHASGTAGAIFGLMYYLLISIFTALMSAIHDATALPMSIFFLILALIMLALYPITIRHKEI